MEAEQRPSAAGADGVGPARVLVTGGNGFIGSAVVRHLLRGTTARVLNLDALTYAGDPSTVADVVAESGSAGRYVFLHADIADRDAVDRALAGFRPEAVVHLAAESHVDRSIDSAAAFVRTNVVGSHVLLEAATGYWRSLGPAERDRFRFLHVSTDEVYGDLGPGDSPFTERSPYRPSSPYAATKAASDHLVRAWHRTHGLPILVTNCSNNYGPYQFPEKLIPVVIRNAVAGRRLPVYGRGDQIRDWLFVDDHARALWLVLGRGVPGETYNVGGHNEVRNLETVEAICALLDELRPEARAVPHRDLIELVADRPGHDRRYAVDAGKIERELGWRPAETFASGLRKTVAWYLAHPGWRSETRGADRRGLGWGGAAAADPTAADPAGRPGAEDAAELVGRPA